MWIIRLPIALVTLAIALLCAALAAGVTATQLGLALDHDVWRAFAEQAANANWIQAALWTGAALCFFIAAVRLLRRTFAFFFWLAAFAFFGVRWWMMRQAEGALPNINVAEISSVEGAQAAAIEASRDYGLVALAALLGLGLLILLIDAVDRAHRNRADV
ncbi:MAG: hypothetical protein AB7J28_01070 [Hyphomonadaceae bacterium]